MARKQNEIRQRFRRQYEANRKIILNTQTVCAICGKPVDKSLKFPDPMSATVDHIIPIEKGGHPFDIDNLQLAHLHCNTEKNNKIIIEKNKKVAEQLAADEAINQNLPQSMDWTAYKGD